VGPSIQSFTSCAATEVSPGYNSIICTVEPTESKDQDTSDIIVVNIIQDSELISSK